MYILLTLVLKAFPIRLPASANVATHKFKLSATEFDCAWFNLASCLRNTDNLTITNNDKYWLLSISFCTVCFSLLSVKSERLGILMLRLCEALIEESC